MALGSENIVWASTKASRAEGKLSVLACAEVILSIIAYWWIAYAFDTYLHLIVSICVAPLVLLRSKPADDMAVTNFLTYMDEDEEIPLRSAKSIAIIAASVTTSVLICWLLAEIWLAPREGWALFWRTMIVGWFGVNIGFAIATAVAGAAAVGGAAAAAGAAAIGGAVAAAGAAAIGGAVAVAVATGQGVFAGLLLRAVYIRVTAALKFFRTGFLQAPENWRRILLGDDLAYAPELIPGIADHDESATLAGGIKAVRNQVEVLGKLLLCIALPILFLPSLLYRYSIKSTAWLYFPIIYIATASPRMADPKAREKWAQAQPTKLMEWFRMLAAAVTLLTFVATIAMPLIVEQQLTDLLQKAGMGEVPISVFSLILVLDWQAFTQIDGRPWQYFTLPSALITVVLFFWLDALGKDAKHGVEDSTLGWQSRIAHHLSRLRTVLVICWLALAFYYVMAEFHALCDLPDAFWWLQSLLNLRFEACQLP